MIEKVVSVDLSLKVAVVIYKSTRSKDTNQTVLISHTKIFVTL